MVGSGRYDHSGASHGRSVRRVKEAASAPRARPVEKEGSMVGSYLGESKVKRPASTE